MTSTPLLQAELDLAISNMDSGATEAQARSILAKLPGILSARLHELGALITYRPQRITKNTICDHLRRAGLDATVFQDSASGATGSVAY